MAEICQLSFWCKSLTLIGRLCTCFIKKARKIRKVNSTACASNKDKTFHQQAFITTHRLSWPLSHVCLWYDMLRVEYEMYWKVISSDYLSVTWSLPMGFLVCNTHQCDFEKVKSMYLLAVRQKLQGCREYDEVSS